ncbi:hypothetical protein NESM_000429300 [Novymonas esmeraldas]|uniref:Uncharacterized protein n=1 Tax=Novymonas esmeraldas TaxID=1808958 RepID=A0AAW0ENW2_9TRYP
MSASRGAGPVEPEAGIIESVLVLTDAPPHVESDRDSEGSPTVTEEWSAPRVSIVAPKQTASTINTLLHASAAKTSHEAPPAADAAWRCAACHKVKDLKGPHLNGKASVRSDCWPCAKKTTFILSNSGASAGNPAAQCGASSKPISAGGAVSGALGISSTLFKAPVVPSESAESECLVPPLQSATLAAPAQPPSTSTAASSSPPAADAAWRCAACHKVKDLKGPHLNGKTSVRSDCWPCAKKTTFMRTALNAIIDGSSSVCQKPSGADALPVPTDQPPLTPAASSSLPFGSVSGKGTLNTTQQAATPFKSAFGDTAAAAGPSAAAAPFKSAFGDTAAAAGPSAAAAPFKSAFGDTTAAAGTSAAAAPFKSAFGDTAAAAGTSAAAAPFKSAFGDTAAAAGPSAAAAPFKSAFGDTAAAAGPSAAAAPFKSAFGDTAAAAGTSAAAAPFKSAFGDTAAAAGTSAAAAPFKSAFGDTTAAAGTSAAAAPFKSAFGGAAKPAAASAGTIFGAAAATSKPAASSFETTFVAGGGAAKPAAASAGTIFGAAAATSKPAASSFETTFGAFGGAAKPAAGSAGTTSGAVAEESDAKPGVGCSKTTSGVPCPTVSQGRGSVSPLPIDVGDECDADGTVADTTSSTRESMELVPAAPAEHCSAAAVEALLTRALREQRDAMTAEWQCFRKDLLFEVRQAISQSQILAAAAAPAELAEQPAQMKESLVRRHLSRAFRKA